MCTLCVGVVLALETRLSLYTSLLLMTLRVGAPFQVTQALEKLGSAEI